jgi:hypothetical protein
LANKEVITNIAGTIELIRSEKAAEVVEKSTLNKDTLA